MPSLVQHPELERRLLRWTGSSAVPRYPFFEGPMSSSVSMHKASGSFDSSASARLVASRSLEDLRRWFNDIELAANDCHVPEEQFPDVAIYFMRGDLKEVMKERKEAYVKETKKGWWEWVDFKEDLKRIVEEAAKMISTPSGVSNLASTAIDQMHPYIASSIKLGLIVGGTAVLLPALGMMAWRRMGAVTSPTVNSPH